MAELGLTAYANERKALQEQVIHQLTSLAELKEQALQTWLQEREADVELLAVNYLNQKHFTELFDDSIPESRRERIPLHVETVPPFPVRQTTMAAAILAGHLHFARDLAAAQDSTLDRLLYTEGLRSRIAVSLTVEGKVVGMIGMGWRAVAGYDLVRLALLNQVAGTLALALARWQLFGEVQRRADQLKGDFIRNITYELKTPVTVLSGYTELLLYDDHENLRADQMEMLAAISVQAQHLARLVNDVVALHRVLRESEEKAPLSICVLAKESLDEIQRTLRVDKSARYRFMPDCPEQDLMVQGNADQLARLRQSAQQRRQVQPRGRGDRRCCTDSGRPAGDARAGRLRHAEPSQPWPHALCPVGCGRTRAGRSSPAQWR